MRTYLVNGDQNVTDLETAVREQGRELSQLGSLLEPASGFERLTQFLVMPLDPRRIAVSDINPLGVNFARQSFGVSGFHSTASATELDHNRQYFEVVIPGGLGTVKHVYPHKLWGTPDPCIIEQPASQN